MSDNILAGMILIAAFGCVYALVWALDWLLPYDEDIDGEY